MEDHGGIDKPVGADSHHAKRLKRHRQGRAGACAARIIQNAGVGQKLHFHILIKPRRYRVPGNCYQFQSKWRRGHLGVNIARHGAVGIGGFKSIEGIGGGIARRQLAAAIVVAEGKLVDV